MDTSLKFQFQQCSVIFKQSTVFTKISLLLRHRVLFIAGPVVPVTITELLSKICTNNLI
jgi:hypothetical protein